MEHKRYVLIFSTSLSATFLILGRNEKDMIKKMYIGLHVQYLLYTSELNPLNAELNPICYLLALLVHHFLHVSRKRVK